MITRLTERDLSRIVKRVLKESTGEPIKVKVFSLTDKYMTKRDCNIEVTNLKLSGTIIRFNYKIAGNGWCKISHTDKRYGEIVKRNRDLPVIGEGRIICGDWKERGIDFIIEETETDEDIISGFLSKEGYAKLSKKCDEYASVDADDMNNNFV